MIRKYLQQILEGLEYLHSHNIIHKGKKFAKKNYSNIQFNLI
jgi:serine/threonine protein kinase